MGAAILVDRRSRVDGAALRAIRETFIDQANVVAELVQSDVVSAPRVHPWIGLERDHATAPADTFCRIERDLAEIGARIDKCRAGLDECAERHQNIPAVVAETEDLTSHR